MGLLQLATAFYVAPEGSAIAHGACYDRLPTKVAMKSSSSPLRLIITVETNDDNTLVI